MTLLALTVGPVIGALVVLTVVVLVTLSLTKKRTVSSQHDDLYPWAVPAPEENITSPGPEPVIETPVETVIPVEKTAKKAAPKKAAPKKAAPKKAVKKVVKKATKK